MNGILYEIFMFDFFKYLLKEIIIFEGEEVFMEVLVISFFFYVDSIIYKSEGRFVKFGDLKLLNLDELLYIFII